MIAWKLAKSCFSILLILLLCSPAFAFGRRGCSNGQCSAQAAPVQQAAAVATQPASLGVKPSGPDEHKGDLYRSLHRHAQLHNRDAQGVANIMASRNAVGHHGGNRGYEGCGCGATPQAAYSICCYGNSGMATVDVGYARSASGMWFCCRRYGR